MSGFSLSGVTNWFKSAASSFSDKSGLTGFLADPVGSATDYLTDQAVQYTKQQLLGKAGLSQAVDMPSAPMVGRIPSTGVRSTPAFSATKSRAPGMNNPTIRSAASNLLNSQQLRSRNVQLVMNAVPTNIRASSGNIGLGGTTYTRTKPIKTVSAK